MAAKVSFSGNFCIEVSPIPNFVVIFGASGDLAKRKLVPALLGLYGRGLFHEKSRVIGCGRAEMDDESFRAKMRAELGESAAAKAGGADKLDAFIKCLHYVSGGYDDPATYDKIEREIAEVEKEARIQSGRLYYLAVPAELHAVIINGLGAAGMVEEKDGDEGAGWRNVVIEKPFGRDLDSARQLDREVRAVLKERQIYRIDHYLGKDTVQNIMMLRFANAIFEPIWNNHYIDHVQVTVAESLGVERRAGYYDHSGQLRDMFQNHMLEMLSLTAMEPPASFAADAVRDEKAKLLKAIRHFPLKSLDEWVVRGQYAAGSVRGQTVPGYLEEEGVGQNSRTETFVAAKLLIDNWRWQGVPFYMRSGKRLPVKSSRIDIVFRKVPHSIFQPLSPGDLSPSRLTIKVQPEEGLELGIMAKQPGPKLCMGNLGLSFKYSDIFGEAPPDAYERLLLDAMLGDQTLFIRGDNVERSWELLTPVLETWENSPETKPPPYPAGAWGPPAADELINRDGRRWILG